jgi:copper transport protein
VGLLAVVLGVAANSRRMVLRTSAASRPGALSRLVGTELGITAAVLAVTAVLVQTNPGRTIDIEAVAAARAKGFSTTLACPLYSLQFEIYPAAVGDYNSFHAFAYTPEGRPLVVREWKVTAALPERGIEPIDNPVATLIDNQGLGNISFPLPGRWELTLTLRTTDIDQATVRTAVEVR